MSETLRAGASSDCVAEPRLDSRSMHVAGALGEMLLAGPQNADALVRFRTTIDSLASLAKMTADTQVGPEAVEALSAATEFHAVMTAAAEAINGKRIGADAFALLCLRTRDASQSALEVV